jgi:Tol biopolymer transport system component
MRIAPGARLGHFEVTSLIGHGGMGEVYRARDTRLNRDVAIKMLPVELAADRERLARLTREAQTLASLNHPNIAQIHGLEEAPSAGSGDLPVRALVMEFVEGDDLSAVIAQAKHPFSVDETIAIARQVAAALEAAHAHGVVHRDLKPANVKVRPDGTVKVLDFGLAKAVEPAQSSEPRSRESVSNSPTITSPAMTQVGMLLGTAAYMSPEQAKGRAVDKRSDLWAFGAMLFELLSGRRPFAGEDVSDTLANVLKTEPDWSLLPADVPPRVLQVIRACLKKHPHERLADAQDARLALDGAFETVGPTPVGPGPSPRKRWVVWAGLVGTAVAAATLGALSTWFLVRQVSSPAPTRRLSMVLPANRAFAPGGQPHRGIGLSADGSLVVYVARDPNAPLSEPTRLVLRSLSTLGARDLQGTEGARQPFFSPDGQWIGFFTSDGALKKVRLSGGNPITLAENIVGAQWSFGVWTDDNRIVFGGGSQDGLRIIDAGGGNVSQLTNLDTASKEREHLAVAPVEGTRAVLFTVRYESARDPQIEAVFVPSGERQVVLENAFNPLVIGSGHLLFQRDDGMLVVPFDRTRLQATGPAEPVTEDVRLSAGSTPTAQLAVSRNGHAAYLPAIDSAQEVGLVDRTGQYTSLGLPAGRFLPVPLVSPDGRLLAYTSVSSANKAEVYVQDLSRGTTRKITHAEAEFALAWHPTEAALAMFVTRDKERGIFLRGLDGSERPLVQGEGRDLLRNASFSADGRLFAYTDQRGSLHDIWISTLGASIDTKPWLNTTEQEHSPRFSPNGRWVAYVMGGPVTGQVWVRRFPDGESVPVSVEGGTGPAWSRDGTELFFDGIRGGSRALFRVAIAESGGSLKVGAPEPLFEMRRKGPDGFEPYAASGNQGTSYAVLPDGKHFVVIKARAPQESREIVVVENWVEELRRGEAPRWVTIPRSVARVERFRLSDPANASRPPRCRRHRRVRSPNGEIRTVARHR